MTAHSENKTRRSELVWYRIGYSAFVMLSVYYLVFSKDLSSAASNLGIALIFDPFDQRVTWNDRPRWQKIWLLVHVSVVILLFALMIMS